MIQKILNALFEPFGIDATREAIAELEAGKGQHFISIDDLMVDLNADDQPITTISSISPVAEALHLVGCHHQ